MNLAKHTEWIKKAIDSCDTSEQLECCRVLISLFVSNMAKYNVPILEIRSVEDALLEKFLTKYFLLKV